MTDRPGGVDGERARELTRERLLATAERQFLSQGFTRTSVEAVAAEAGYTTGAIYSNFGGKADLFIAVLERAAEQQRVRIGAALDAAQSDEQRLAVFSDALDDRTRWQARVRATIEFLGHVGHHPELHPRMVAAQRMADETAGELLTALCSSLGVEPPTEMREFVRTVVALSDGLAIRSLYDEDLDPARAFSSGLNLMLTGAPTDLRERADVGD
jgi:AcrR family transcriptional regulator